MQREREALRVVILDSLSIVIFCRDELRMHDSKLRAGTPYLTRLYESKDIKMIGLRNINISKY